MRLFTLSLALLSVLLCSGHESRLERLDNGRARLTVDGSPYFIIGGETGNSMASCPGDVSSVMDKAERHAYNTVLIPMAWELIEPREGQWDFTSVDTIIGEATRRGLKIVPLWFGAWKNSMSCYAPEWVKRDVKRFPRAMTASGKPLEIVSTFSPEVYEADSRAFRALLSHIAATDTAGTVIMIQIENEIGMLEDARDHSPLAEKAYRKGVPQQLTDYLNQYSSQLHPVLASRLHEAGGKTSGSWEEVFGPGIYTDEIFQAWAYALYVEKLAREARKVFPTMPLYVNAAMNSRGRIPGQYPSAGPLAHLKDIWHAAAPTLDILAPDLYDSGFTSWVAAYALPDNPLFVPEIKCGRENTVQAYYALGEHGAIGLSPFAYNLRPESEIPYQHEGNSLLKSLFPLLQSDYYSSLPTAGFYFDQDSTSRTITRGDIAIKASHFFTLPWDPRATDGTRWPVAGGLLLPLSPEEFIVAGSGIVLTFEPVTATADTSASPALGEDGFLLEGGDKTSSQSRWHGKRIGLASVEEVKVSPDGSLKRVRTLNGDETHQGRHVRIGVDNFQILRVKLYKY